MKITDFLRMKITPDNRQFDMIKNIRFLDDKNKVLVGNGTVTVHAFCEAFFDYVYRNYSSSRGAEKLIKQNRKKYQKFSGSESMILVQKILDEICEDYAISSYNITCEVDSLMKKGQPAGNQKTAAPAASPKTAAAPAQEAAKTAEQTSSEVAKAEAQPAQAAPVNTAPNTEKHPENNVKTEQPPQSRKMQALRSELERMQPQENLAEVNTANVVNEPVQNTVEKVEGQSLRDNLRFGGREPRVNIPDGTVMIDGKPVPIKENNAEPVVQAEQPVAAEPVSQDIQPQEVIQETQPQEAVQEAVAETVPEAAPAAVQAQPAPETPQNSGKAVEEEDCLEKDVENMGFTGYIIAADNEPKNNNNNNNNNNYNNKKDKKNKKKQQDFPDSRIKPGKGIPPIKDLKPVAKFQDAGITKSKLKLENIPCIAVVEENIVPTMEEVPCIAVVEDNTVPSMSEVPFIGIEEGGEPEIPSSYNKEPEKPIEYMPKSFEQQAPVQQPAASSAPVQEAPVQTAPVQEVTVQPVVEQVYVQPTPPVQEAAPEIHLEFAPRSEGKTLYQASTQTSSLKPVSDVKPLSSKPFSQPKRTHEGTGKDLRTVIAEYVQKNKQVVFTGPSGTGKTYQIRRFARNATKGYDGFKFVQFHPAFEYGDFIEGLRPANIINTNAPTNVRLDGVFKAFCRTIVEDNLKYAVQGFETMYNEKKQKVVQTLFDNIRDRKEAIDEGRETEYFAMDSSEYIFENGVRDYYFIIDELNRADVAKVFGDVLFSLDEDYRGIENRFDTRLANLKTYRIIQADDIGKANYSTSHIGYAEQMKFDCFERGFFIPKNLHIICSMNEIENNSDNIGFAFKHKFRWVDIDPEEIMLSSLSDIHKDKDIYWLDRFAENVNLVNRLIGESFSNEYRIGPAYFRKLNESTNSIDHVFDTSIEPLLLEYLKGKPADITERFITECRKALHMGI